MSSNCGDLPFKMESFYNRKKSENGCDWLFQLVILHFFLLV
jgi:hypothetical protein